MAWTTVAHPSNAPRKRRKRVVSLNNGTQQQHGDAYYGSYSNYNMLSQVYRGRYDRIERYRIYDWMDQDSDISRALDLIAEHCTDKDETNGFHHVLHWAIEEPNEETVELLREHQAQWSKINEFNNRMFRIMRNVVKYGDWFLFRDQSFQLYSLHPKFVLGALIDSQTLETIGWVVKNFKFNIDDIEMNVDSKVVRDYLSSYNTSGKGDNLRHTRIIPAAHILHLSLSEGRFAGAANDDDPNDMSNNRWPFGESWLEQSYKVFKQRELLEDAFLIHRVQRAPTRNIWYVDTGKMRQDRARWQIENFKNELNQNRIPQTFGNNNKGVDSVYNPISQLEDIYIPVSFEQRGSKVEQLDGQAWDQIPDLDYFTEKMIRSLRVPFSWMGIGANKNGVFNDARVGVAYQEELEFSRFCTRVQNNVDSVFDFEFKLYLGMRDVAVNPADFDLKFNPPTNWKDFIDNARDQDNVNLFEVYDSKPYIAKRTALKKGMKWSDAEILENETALIEEQKELELNLSGGPSLGGPAGGLGGLGGPAGGLGGLGGPEGGLGGELGTDASAMSTGGGLGGPGAGAMAGGGVAGGGFGESNMKKQGMVLIEGPITMDDIKSTPQQSTEEPYQKQTPNDQVWGKATKKMSKGSDPTVLTNLSTIRKIRMHQMNKRIEDQKRLKNIQKIYSLGAADEGGGLL